MDPDISAFKSCQRTTRVPSTALDIQYLVKLYNIISDLNKEAADLESSKLLKTGRPNGRRILQTKRICKKSLLSKCLNCRCQRGIY